MPPKQHQARSAGVERLVSPPIPFGSTQKMGASLLRNAPNQPQKKVYGFRDLLRSFSCSLAGDSAEHNDVRRHCRPDGLCRA